jgi:hypothetical protein
MFAIKKRLLLTALLTATQVNAQITSEVEVTDGTTSTCYGTAGAASCTPFSTSPAVDTLVRDAAGNSSEIRTNSGITTVQTTSGSNVSGMAVKSDATALESSGTVGYAAFGTQVGTSSATGNSGGQVVGVARDASSNFSEFLLEGQVASIRTKDGVTGARSVLETAPTQVLMGYAADGVTVVQGVQATSSMTTLLGNSTANSNFTVVGATTTNGIDNQNAGITNAGLISGVTAGAVSATSTEAINGSQLYTTNTNVTTAKTTADTALANAATAQTTATAAQTTATTAKTTADTALANAATAQTTATAAQTTATNAAIVVASFDSRVSSAESNASAALAKVSTFDSRITNLENEVRKTNNVAKRGVAIATAIASVPQLESGKRFSVGAGLGNYSGKNAFAVALNARLSNSVTVRLNAGTSDGGDAAVGVGGAFSW